MIKTHIELFEQMESEGWTVVQEGSDEYRIGKFSPAGQDFSVVIEGKSVEDLIQSLKDAHESYDVSYETMLWLDDSGHGVNGAPHDMKEVYEDMESCKENLKVLYEKVTAHSNLRGDK